VSDRKIGDLDQEPLVKQFAYNPSPLYKGLVSCVGNDYCNLAVIETKGRAVETANALEATVGRGSNRSPCIGPAVRPAVAII
jgi:ferredoxin-nitrite reductase